MVSFTWSIRSYCPTSSAWAAFAAHFLRTTKSMEKQIKAILIAAVAAGGLFLTPIVSAHDTGSAPGYYYPPYPYYGGGNSDFFEDGSFYGDSRGSGRGSGSGEGEFNMNMSGKGKGEQSREGSFGGSGYGGSGGYPYQRPYGYGAPPMQR